MFQNKHRKKEKIIKLLNQINLMALIIKSNIKKVLRELDKEGSISSVAEEVGRELERKTEEILDKAIKRAKANGRRTLQARDL